MEFRGKQLTALGALVILAALLFVWGMFYMMGSPVLAGGLHVVVAMDDGAGLKRGDRVHLQGVTVGSVRGVELAPSRRVLVDLRLDSGMELAADTRAVIRSDVFGVHTVELVPGEALVRLQKADTIRGVAAPALPDLMTDLGTRATAVLTAADSLLSPRVVADMQATASVLPASAAEFHAAITELRLAAAALRGTAESIEAADAAEAVTRVLGEMEGSARAFTTAAESLDRSLQTMDRSLHAMDRSLSAMASVVEKIDRGDGTLGRLVNDPSMYEDLHDAVREVRLLTADIRERPGRYLSFRIF